MAKSKKYVLSIEVYKYPYCGTLDDAENYLSEKICLCTIKIRKKLLEKRSGLLVYGDFILRLINGGVPSQAIGLPISPQTPPIMRSIYLKVGLSKKAIITQVIKEMPAEMNFTEKEINQLYNLSIECRNNSLSQEELVLALKSGGMEIMANSLSPEYSEFQKKHNQQSLTNRFDTNKCSAKKFKDLAQDSRSNIVKYDRVSIDEARAVIQAELQNVVIQPTRASKLEARRVDLDYKVKGPGLLTHVDIKYPVGSKILKKQGQTVTVEDMAYKMGQKIVQQKHRFVGLENGPVSHQNVGHIVDLCYVPNNEKTIVKQNI